VVSERDRDIPWCVISFKLHCTNLYPRFSKGATLHEVFDMTFVLERRLIPQDIRSPDEYPFTSDLPDPVLPPLSFPQILYPNKINANPSILSFYTRAIVPRITRRATLALATKMRASGIVGDEESEDDGNHGSAATLDVEVLQSISKRVHYGTCQLLLKLTG